MNRRLFLALFLPLLAAECVAQFVLHNQHLTELLAVLGLGVIAVRWVLGPQTPADTAGDPAADTSGDWDAPAKSDRDFW